MYHYISLPPSKQWVGLRVIQEATKMHKSGMKDTNKIMVTQEILVGLWTPSKLLFNQNSKRPTLNSKIEELDIHGRIQTEIQKSEEVARKKRKIK